MPFYAESSFTFYRTDLFEKADPYEEGEGVVSLDVLEAAGVNLELKDNKSAAAKILGVNRRTLQRKGF